MRLLVTGGAGFIGSHVCERLLHDGHDVVAADNLRLGRIANIEHLFAKPAFAFTELDVADAEAIDGLVSTSEFDAVFHLAANSDIARSHDDPATDLRNTFLTTYSVLEAMRKNGVGQLIFSSTSAIYGEAPGQIAEDRGPLLPISHYGAAKLASEAFISSYATNYGIRAWIARFPNVVGDRLTHGVIHDFAQKLGRTPGRLEVLGDGAQVKPYLHVSDLVSAILLIWRTCRQQVNYFNIGGDTRLSVRRIAEIMAEEYGADVELSFTGGDRGWVGDVPSVEYDTSKLKALGWSPSLDSQAAVRAAVRAVLETAP